MEESSSSKSNLTRRTFVGGAAAAAATAALAGCTSSDSTEDSSGSSAAATTSGFTVHDAADYPIAVDGDDVEALWTSEEMRDGWTKVTNPDGGSTVSVKDTAKIIPVAGYAFRDINGNGELDFWEDWRQSDEDRATAAANELTYDKCLGLMLNPACPVTDLDLEYDMASSANLFGDDDPSTVSGAIEEGIISILQRGVSSNPQGGAQWNNMVQEYAESIDSLPVEVCLNPQDFGFPCNLGMAATFDPELVRQKTILESKGYRAEGVHLILGPQIDLTTDPRWYRYNGTFGDDPALSRDMTNAYCSGLQSTYDEDGNDLGWGEESVTAQIKHFPGDGAGEGGRESHSDCGKYCVYPGDALNTSLINFLDGGLNLDSATGVAGSVMPSYSIAYSDDGSYGELVGSGMSEYKISILRDNCDYIGMIRTDSGITFLTNWGCEDKTSAEIMAMSWEAGCDQIGGSGEMGEAKNAYALMEEDLGEDGALERVRESAMRVLLTELHADLFDNPFVDSISTLSVVQSDELSSLAAEMTDKSIIMVKNVDNVICERTDDTKPKVYIPAHYIPIISSAIPALMGDSAASISFPVSDSAISEYFDYVTDTIAEEAAETDEDGNAVWTESDITRLTADDVADCDYAIVFMGNPVNGNGIDNDTGEYIPITLQYGEYTADGENVRQTSIAGDVVDGEQENRSYYGKTVTADNACELDEIKRVKELMGDKPVIVCMDADRPFVPSEFEEYADAILVGPYISSTFGNEDAFINVLAGQVEPTGLLPFQLPADMDTVEGQYEDMPRDMEAYVDSQGNTYDFAFGMNWSGVISDDRTATYAVDPLTEPETITL